VLQELTNGNLVGIVRGSNGEKLRPFLSPPEQGGLNDAKANGGVVTDNADTFTADNGAGFLRGFTLMNNDKMDNSVPGGTFRTFMKLVLAHELTHFRNRVNAANMDNDATFDSARYVDPVLADALGNTHRTRSRFINELACRHVAWRVQCDLQHTAAILEKGQFFNAANAFAFACVKPRGDYSDNGYMQALVPRVADFNRQVGLWMKDLDSMLFHNDAARNNEVRQLVRDEIAFVQPTYAVPLVEPDGMA